MFPRGMRMPFFKSSRIRPGGGCCSRWRAGRRSARPRSKADAHLRLDATLKHLVIMRAAGLLAVNPDPQDGRRMLYSLLPAVPVVVTPTGRGIDFGFCLLRW